MKKLEKLYEGKAKIVYKTQNKDLFLIEYKDDATAFNGEKKGIINNKGIVNNKMSAALFKILESNGIPTHFEEIISDREMLVKAVHIIPIEVIVRNIAAGSLCKRLGFKEGIKLNKTVLEFCLKDDKLGDPMINEDHIEALSLSTKQQLLAIKDYSLKINNILKNYFLDKNIKIVDFKLEFGLYNQEVILADEISPDTCRLWDSETNKKLDKDRFRFELGEIEEVYQEILQRINA